MTTPPAAKATPKPKATQNRAGSPAGKKTESPTDAQKPTPVKGKKRCAKVDPPEPAPEEPPQELAQEGEAVVTARKRVNSKSADTDAESQVAALKEASI